MTTFRAALMLVALIWPIGSFAQTAPTYVAPVGTTPSTSQTSPTRPDATAPSTPAKAATPTQPKTRGTSTATTTNKAQQKVSTQLIEPTPLTGDPTAVNARLPGLKTQPKLADIGDKLSQVMLVGTPKVSSGGRVVIDWTTVARSDTGQTVTLTAPLASGIRTTAQTLPAKTTIVARGNADELYDAIRTLFGQQQSSTGTATTNGSSSRSSGGSTPTAGGQQTTNGDVKTLASKQSEDAGSSDEDTTVSVTTTTEGCQIRVDISQGVAIQQEATITTVNGKAGRGACEDGGTRFPIKKTGLSCTDEVRETEAQGQTRLYYIDSVGKEVQVQGCQLDNELIYPIVDEAGSCPMFIDQQSRKAFDQAERVYRNNMNVRIVVADCQQTGDGYTLETTTDGCSFRDDFTAGKTWQQVRDYFEKDGTLFYTGACYDKDPAYTVQYEECAVNVDLPAGTVYTAHKAYIDGPTGKVYRSECTPYGSASALMATTDGCQTVHYDYPASDQSRGAERFFYMQDGVRQYVTQCQESTATFAWSWETTGYQNDDPAKTSTAIMAASITMPDVGVVQVAVPAVRPASAIIPYVFQDVQDVANGDPKTYLGCNAYTPTDRVESYLRADNTTYNYAVGTGTPAGPNDECTRTEEYRAIYYSSSCSTTGCAGYATSPAVSWYSGNPSYGIQSQANYTNYLIHERRSVTTMPAGAGGGTTYGDWVFTNYTYYNTYTYTAYKTSAPCSMGCNGGGSDR